MHARAIPLLVLCMLYTTIYVHISTEIWVTYVCIHVCNVHVIFTYVLNEDTKDPSFTPPNLISALDELPDKLWNDFGKEVNVSESILHNIEHQFHTDGERKAELLRVCVTEHPEPTWERVSDALYRCKMGDEECHRTLDILQSKFPTGEPLIPNIPSLTPFTTLSLPKIFVSVFSGYTTKAVPYLIL